MFYTLFSTVFSFFWKMSEVEVWAAKSMDELLKTAVTCFNPTKIAACFTAIASLFGFIVNRTPVEPFGEGVDLTGYTLVFEDNFDGDSLDMTNWRFRNCGKSYNGFYAPDTVFVKDGNLHIQGRYLEDGSMGPGWYAAEIATINHYTQGYFECRCICGKGPFFWSAFWIQSPFSGSKESDGGRHGVELDICEANAENSDIAKGTDSVLQCLHVNGGTDDPTDSVDTSGAIFFNGSNVYSEYNTYAVKWDEEYYTFYVNGKETLKTAWRDGTSTVPEEVILSVCIPGSDPDKKLDRETFCSDFVIDYVKIYQKETKISTAWE